MPVSAPKQSIPTVAEAVRRFLEARQRKSWREHASVLAGPPTGHVTGRKAGGPALARSEFGPLRFDRVTSEQFSKWLLQRHPEHLSPSTFRRGRSSLRRLLLFAAANGWAEDAIADQLPDAKAAPPRRDWLRPEQLIALEPLVTRQHFDEDLLWMWWLGLNAGLRAEEVVSLKPSAFDFLDQTVTVVGKGSKRREVPLSPEFSKALVQWFAGRAARPDAWLFPLTGIRFVNVPHHRASERVVLDPKRHADAKAFRSLCARVNALAREKARSGEFPGEHLPHRVITPHTLRRTYACNQLIAAHVLGSGQGMDLRTLQQALGHASLEHTSLYLSDVSSYLRRYQRPISVSEAASVIVDIHEGMESGRYARLAG